MTRDKLTDLAASVRQRLLNIIRQTGDDPNLVWTRYATERFLYRLSVSEHAADFTLKGAMLFVVWTGRQYRPTVDMDLLARGEGISERLENVFHSLCRIEVEPDGLVFDADTVKVVPIREEQAYAGQRITLTGFLGKARIPIQIDVGFGDAVTPRAKKITYPTLLDFPAPTIRAYQRETVVAEKLHAMVILDIANSRMKDFYDLYVLARDFSFDGAALSQAIKATFRRRETEIPIETPLALTDEFSRDNVKTVQWKAFVRKNDLEEGLPELPRVILFLQKFLIPVIESASGNSPVPQAWNSGGPWVDEQRRHLD